jgi:hypothetical protein
MKKLRTKFYGQAGEYYALFRLWETGIAAVSAPPGARRVDLLLFDTSFTLLATVQVKTRSTKNENGWLISRKHIEHSHPDHFYIFVELDLRPNGIPTSYVVPSGVIAKLGRQVINSELKAPKISEHDRRQAVSDPSRFNCVVLKPVLDEPHEFLGEEWPKTFDNAYEIITEPLFRAAAVRLARQQVIRS